MPRAITLRSDFTASDLRRLARLSRDAPQARRLLALAAICDGGLYFCRCLPAGGQGRGPVAALLQYRSDEPAFG